ncbi:baculoviral IAP repeat-containing protein 7-A-like [Ruditapes philippinarum]|uniref:baculoviral IAP repeat-containing protein 7-A-like n=1 Tax=Ruditapes philippinarum TaxID=129788 RepID=UPI00295B8FFA|nr:baculoviral IAP repeat-containing protein 7-A-like [Ruditapes philippinarum]
MADVLPRPNTSEYLREYFRKPCRRNQNNGQIAGDSWCKESLQSRNCVSECDNLGIWTGKPKYREYSTVQSRLVSFKNWPQNKTQTIEQLVDAGFAFTGVDDSVRCYYCSIGLRDWPEGACPWKQHILASPKCGHVIQCKGKSFIRHVLGEQAYDSGSDVDDSDEVIDTVQLAIQRNEDAVNVAREYCSNEDVLKRAIKSLIAQDLNKRFTAVELVKTVQDIEEICDGSILSFPLERKDDKDKEESSDEETEEDVVESIEEMEAANRELKEPVTCKVCLDAIACIITLPCGHMMCCSQCVPALSKCAVCRAQIKGTVRALMAF